MDRAHVWDLAFAAGDEQRSWFEQHPTRSLAAINAIARSPQAPIIDVGGGASRLTDVLLAAGYRDLTVLDVSSAALEQTRWRLGSDAEHVNWITSDLLTWAPARRYAIWHDRAVLHFFVDRADQHAYVEALHAALAPGGHAIIATFAPDGPEQCSGLPVRRASADDILALLGKQFDAIETRTETHTTPSGNKQPFTWVIARRRARTTSSDRNHGTAVGRTRADPSRPVHNPAPDPERE